MGYCAYEELVGKIVVVYDSDPRNIFAVVGTLDGVGQTALGIKDWQILHLGTCALVGKLNRQILVVNKRTGFRKISLLSNDIVGFAELANEASEKVDSRFKALEELGRIFKI